jgi:hypothetical protein
MHGSRRSFGNYRALVRIFRASGCINESALGSSYGSVPVHEHSAMLPDLNAQSRGRSTQLTPRGAMVLGGIFVLFGLFPILAGLGLVSVRFPPGIRAWVVVAAGSMFTLAGISLINNALAGGVQPDGGLADGAPFAARLVGYLLGLAILSLMCVLFAWTAFGSGERHFSSWMSFAGRSLPTQSSERSGRIAFGICAGFLAVFLAFTAVGGAKQLRRGRNQS